MRAAILVFLAILPIVNESASAQTSGASLTLASLSSRPETVSGGDLLVKLTLPGGAQTSPPVVTLNGADVTSAFRPGAAAGTFVALITGLTLGSNEIAAGAARLTVVNHPTEGPIFSGPHEQPFICETDTFKVPSGAAALGKPLDANCSIKTRIDYYYRSTAGGDLKPFTKGTKPADLAQTKTTEGATVPYIVRIETGTINRAIYELAMLHDPDAERAPDPWTKSAGWNRRLIYTHGGGCTNGWYRQGNTTGGVDDDAMLRQGYAVASASLSVFGNNCNDLLASETMMMVKERFVEAYGPPRFTMGWGCSGGSYQQLQTADNFPGLIDGIMPCRTFPDVGFGTIPTISDARLANHYFKSTATIPFTDEQKRAVVGFLNLATMVNVDSAAGRIQVLEYCPPVLPPAMRYNPTTNPKGARCDVFDHTVNSYGRDPKTGFARRPLDNVGVQYGLAALNGGTITKEQFLELNEKIGGFDNDGNVSPARSVGDLAAIRAAYRTGRLTNAGGGLAAIPIVDYRNYLDDRKDGDIHVRYHSFSLRERLVKANGHSDNHVMLIEDSRGGSTSSAIAREAIAQLDRWLTNLTDDTSNDSQIVKVRRAKPADLVDACWTRDTTPVKIAEKQTRDLSSRCAQIYPSASFPREVAGSSVASDIIKCTLRPIQPSDYKTPFSADEIARLKKMFPDGVCDWSKPGVGQQKLGGTWLKFEANGT